MGIGRLTTVELEPEDTAKRLTLPDPVTGEPAEFFCLLLGENPLGTRGGSRWDEG